MRNQTNNKRWGGAVCGLALVLACCVLPSASHACDGYWVIASRAELREPVTIKPDGSFRTLSANTYKRDEQGGYRATAFEGGVIRDLGSGRVGQRISSKWEACSGTEELLVVDCNALEGIMLTGKEPEIGIAGASYTSIAEIQYPKGPIRLTKTTTVDQIEATARRHDINYTRALYGHFDEMPEHKRYNPYQGCKIFYPDSPGAKR